MSTRPSDRCMQSTFYDIRRYGGLQILLRYGARRNFTGTQGCARVDSTIFLDRAGALERYPHLPERHLNGVSRLCRKPSASAIAPEYVRLSGEIVDQTVLNNLYERYPQARISHAFASTEAGVAFEVKDGEMGFPAELLERSPDVDMKVENHTLRVRSPRTAFRYLNEDCELLKDAEGFVDTGDVLELRAGRYYFVGRRDGTVNVGGMKVHPEEVEAVLNQHPAVNVSLVKTKKSPHHRRASVVADVVLNTSSQPG